MAVAVAGGLILFFFDPARSGFYPPCLFHKLTGLQCPGCGGLRALHHLLHGELLTALQFNALLVVGALVCAGLGLRQAWGRRWGGGGALRVRGAWLWAALVVVLLFGVLRNLDLPFLALAVRP
jgi:hypothetical protein